MRDGTLASLGQALRLLFRRTELWWPGCLGDGILFLLTLGWLKALVIAVVSGGVGWVLLGWLLTMLAWTAWDSARWFAADRVLRGEQADLAVWLAGLRRRGPGWIGGTAALGAGQAVLGIASAVTLLHLFCGGQWHRLLAPSVGLVDGWREQGWPWVAGGAALLAGLGAIRTVLGWVADWWRVALLVERPRAADAMQAAIEFVWFRRWGQTGRYLTRQIIGAAAWFGPLVVAELLSGLLRLAGGELTTLVMLFWLCATAASWSLARAWVKLADLVAWRRHGGLERRAVLAGPVIRPRSQRVSRHSDEAGARLASEPGPALAGWPGRFASEPPE